MTTRLIWTINNEAEAHGFIYRAIQTNEQTSWDLEIVCKGTVIESPDFYSLEGLKTSCQIHCNTIDQSIDSMRITCKHGFIVGCDCPICGKVVDAPKAAEGFEEGLLKVQQAQRADNLARTQSDYEKDRAEYLAKKHALAPASPERSAGEVLFRAVHPWPENIRSWKECHPKVKASYEREAQAVLSHHHSEQETITNLAIERLNVAQGILSEVLAWIQVVNADSSNDHSAAIGAKIDAFLEGKG